MVGAQGNWSRKGRHMVALLLSVALTADTKDPNWLVAISVVAASDAKANLADATKQLAAAKKARINARAFGVNKKGETVYRDREDRLRAIKAAEQEIAECSDLLAGKGDAPQLPARALRVGDFGNLVGSVRVQQVVSDKSAIVDIISDYYGVAKVTAWIDTDTAGWQDDMLLRLASPLIVVGTKQYPTAIGGTRTVLHVRTFTASELKRFLELVKEAAKD